MLVCNTIRTVTTHSVERITPNSIKNMYMLEKNLAVAKNVGNVSNFEGTCSHFGKICKPRQTKGGVSWNVVSGV